MPKWFIEGLCGQYTFLGTTYVVEGIFSTEITEMHCEQIVFSGNAESTDHCWWYQDQV